MEVASFGSPDPHVEFFLLSTSDCVVFRIFGFDVLGKSGNPIAFPIRNVALTQRVVSSYNPRTVFQLHVSELPAGVGVIWIESNNVFVMPANLLLESSLTAILFLTPFRKLDMIGGDVTNVFESRFVVAIDLLSKHNPFDDVALVQLVD